MAMPLLALLAASLLWQPPCRKGPSSTAERYGNACWQMRELIYLRGSVRRDRAASLPKTTELLLPLLPLLVERAKITTVVTKQS